MDNQLLMHEDYGLQVYHLPDGRVHRTDGPAIIYSDGSCLVWCHHGVPHRRHGPASSGKSKVAFIGEGSVFVLGGDKATSTHRDLNVFFGIEIEPSLFDQMTDLEILLSLCKRFKPGFYITRLIHWGPDEPLLTSSVELSTYAIEFLETIGELRLANNLRVGEILR